MSELDAKAKEYTVIKNRLALAEPVVLLAFLLVMQLSNLSMNMKYISTDLSSMRYGAIAMYAMLFGLFYYIVTFYLHFYRSYIIEHRFGLSNQCLTDWVKDELKKVIISLILFLIYIEFLYFLIHNFAMWWLLMAIGWILITIVLAKIAPVLIIPLFFKYEPLADTELKERLIRLAEKCNIRILDVFKLKMSAKTKKANAALVGMGKTRRVLLGDTLLENYTKDEIEVVLAHELAHHKLIHMWKLVSFGGLSTLAAFYLVKLSSNALIDTLRLEGIEDLAFFPSIMFVLLLFSILISPAQNAFSRRLESTADLFALKATKLPEAFASCMDKLAKQNLADPSPSRFIELMLYDHPPISKRINMAKKFHKEERDGKE